MHAMLFENQYKLNHNSIMGYGRTLGLYTGKFNEDVASPEPESKVLSDFQSGFLSGANTTPTFFVNDFKYNRDWSSDDFLEYLKIV